VVLGGGADATKVSRWQVWQQPGAAANTNASSRLLINRLLFCCSSDHSTPAGRASPRARPARGAEMTAVPAKAKRLRDLCRGAKWGKQPAQRFTLKPLPERALVRKITAGGS
jgi:hypothetical protein